MLVANGLELLLQLQQTIFVLLVGNGNLIVQSSFRVVLVTVALIDESASIDNAAQFLGGEFPGSELDQFLTKYLETLIEDDVRKFFVDEDALLGIVYVNDST